jgi:hypothetical protein
MAVYRFNWSFSHCLLAIRSCGMLLWFLLSISITGFTPGGEGGADPSPQGVGTPLIKRRELLS